MIAHVGFLCQVSSSVLSLARRVRQSVTSRMSRKCHGVWATLPLTTFP